MLDQISATDSAPTTVQPHDFCGTETQDRLAAWLDVLGLQVELFHPVEFAALAELPSWARAGRVLDVGCGDASYLGALARCFPGKTYAGLEASPEFVAAARAREPGLTVVAADFFAHAPQQRFDIVLMRFVVQHLDDWRAVLAHARRLLAPGGSLLIVEPDTAGFANQPPLPLFTTLLTAYGAAAQARGRLRASLNDLAGQAADMGWHLACEKRRAVISTGRPAISRVLRLYRGWMALCRACGYVVADYGAVELELAAWARDADARSEIGLRLLQLQPD